MKSKITEIINQVSNRTISTDEAIDEILHLFSVINNEAEASSEGVAVCDCGQWHSQKQYDNNKCQRCLKPIQKQTDL